MCLSVCLVCVRLSACVCAWERERERVEGAQEEAPADSWRLVCTSCFAPHMKGSADS